jgi:hypothetical protein
MDSSDLFGDQMDFSSWTTETVSSPNIAQDSEPNDSDDQKEYQVTEEDLNQMPTVHLDIEVYQGLRKEDQTAAGRFTPMTRRILNEWFWIHMGGYLSKEDALQLALQTGLSTKQVRTYMTNKRVRSQSKARPKRPDRFVY